MGLFSFLKGAGAGIFGKKSAAKAAEDLAKHKELLAEEVSKLGLEVEDLEIDLEDDKVTVSGKVETQEVREKIILALGNVEGVASVEDHIEVVTPAPEAVFYEVKSGDTLSKIAKVHYGNAMKYPVIFEANKPMLSDPDKIYPGQRLRIPPLED